MDRVLDKTDASAMLAPREESGDETGRRNWLLFGVVAFLLLIPLPVGGNRPAFVAAATVLIGIAGTWYWGALALDRRAAPAAIGLGWTAPMLFLFTCLALVVQVLPLGLVGLEQRLPDGTSVPSLSLAPGPTLVMLAQFIGYGLFAVLVAQVAGRSRGAMMLLRALVVLTVIHAAAGLAMLTQLGDTYFGLPKEYYLGSATGAFINRNSFATFLAMGLAAGCVLLCASVSGRRRRIGLQTIMIAVGLAVIAVALLATNSRMGVFAGIVGGLFALFAGGLKARFRWWMWLSLFAGIGAGAIVVAPELGAGVLDRLLGVDGALRQRLVLYDQVVTMIAAYPWTGVGGGAFEWVFPMFHAPPLSSAYVWDRAHSTYLALWAELGLVAGSLPMLIVVVLAARSVRRAIRSEEHWAPGLAALAATIVVAIHSLVDFSLEIPANAFFILAYLVAGATARRERGRVA